MTESTWLMDLAKIYVVITLMIALFTRKKFDSIFILFLLWLVVSVITDNAPRFIYENIIIGNSAVWYAIMNLGCIIQFVLLMIMYQKLVFKKLHIKLIKLTFVVAILFQVISVAYGQGVFENFNNINFFISLAGITIAIFVFVKEILNSEKVLELTNYIWFWISAGLILYYVGALPRTFMQNLELPDSIRQNFTSFMNIFNLMVYSIFIYGMIKCKTKPT